MSERRYNVVEMCGIVKDFPGVRALDRVDFAVRAGEIHGLVGENGAGKSTLIKILAGIYPLDAGEVLIHGQTYRSLTPRLIEQLGIQFIYQERYLVPHFTVAQSIFLGREALRASLPILDNRRMREQAEMFMQDTLGVTLSGNALIQDLPVAQRQLVQIAKALIAKPAVIVFDEPTAPLARHDVECLFNIIRRLKEQGITVIYISHYLQEISEICDRVTVLRNGRSVATLQVKESSPDQIVRLMVGRELREMFPSRSVVLGGPILSVRALSRKGQFYDVTFDLRRGEVLGIAGLQGSGREALIETLFGLVPPDAGTLTLMGHEVHRLSPDRAVSGRVALVPQDRREQGLVISMSVAENVNLVALDQVSRMGFVNRRMARDRAVTMINSLDIRTPGPETIVRYLSGGNQQKVVLAKWLSSGAVVYLLSEPTVGIDVGAKVEIYQLINRLVSDGAAVILSSSDILELLGVTDRILMMYRGRIVQEFNSREATPDIMLAWATGGQQEA